MDGLYLFIFIYLFIYFLAMLHSMWDPSSRTRDQTCAPCIGNAES